MSVWLWQSVRDNGIYVERFEALSIVLLYVNALTIDSSFSDTIDSYDHNCEEFQCADASQISIVEPLEKLVQLRPLV